MTERSKRGATYDDLIAAPPDQIAEMITGDLWLSPRPTLRHANASSLLTARLSDAFQWGRHGPGGWWIWFEPELHLLGDVLVPDIAGWRRERLAAVPDGVGIELAPDWVCEVLSPTTERFDRRAKLPRYALAEVRHLWLLDLARKRLEVYGLLDRGWVLLEEHAGDAVASAPPFEEAPLELGRLWG